MDPLMVLPSLSMEDHTMIVTMMTRISLILHCQDLIMETGDSILEITDLSETIMRDIETDMITNTKTDLTMDMMMITGEKSKVMISIIQMILTMIEDSIIMIILQGLTHYLYTKEMEEIIMTQEEEVLISHTLMIQV